ncbi:UDP-2,3-diacylglucosamine diphosphatase [Tundrisphaera lichenicola]|uniref:UDP-2,3-diacylglucosamine diphosphatase n=1 Tax=Tundrisphaera lichenicola TaxID=2029860 RepID=UPI003EBE74FB
MPDFFLSDVHLRLDEPERGHRLARVVDRLGSEDTLTIVGDLCDFWYAARQYRSDPMACAGLASLARFRQRGGPITILAGNHDAWIGPFYEQALGARFVPDTLEVEIQGRRILVAHGHRLGAHTPWKEVLKSRSFLNAFRLVPDPLADALGALLRKTNARNQDAFDRRGLAVYRSFADRQAEAFDVVILGHVHKPTNSEGRPRLVVLGGWHRNSCYLVLDGETIRHVIEPDGS